MISAERSVWECVCLAATRANYVIVVLLTSRQAVGGAIWHGVKGFRYDLQFLFLWLC